MDRGWELVAEEALQDELCMLSAPESLKGFVESIPRQQRSEADAAAHLFTYLIAQGFLRLTTRFLLDEPERASTTLGIAQRNVEALDLAQDLERLGRLRGDLRRFATHLAECAGPRLRLELAGALAALSAYSQDAYELADDPNQLLADARRLQEENPTEALARVGRAGALLLRGRRVWRRWPDELKPPARFWVGALDLLADAIPIDHVLPLQAFCDEAEREAFDTAAVLDELPPPEPPQAEALLREVFCGREQLRPGVAERFRQVGPAMVMPLVDILTDRSLLHPRARGKGWAPGHAAHLLGDLAAPQAVEDLVDAVADMPPDSHLSLEAADALVKLGSAALQSIDEYLSWSENQVAKSALRSIAAQILRGAKRRGAQEVTPRSRPSGSRAGREHVQGPAGLTAAVGRNDPCPCGSGKKYKHCCTRRDEVR
jgi:hypothetical protein